MIKKFIKGQAIPEDAEYIGQIKVVHPIKSYLALENNKLVRKIPYTIVYYYEV